MSIETKFVRRFAELPVVGGAVNVMATKTGDAAGVEVNVSNQIFTTV
jgi:hypothetical protein